MGNDRGKSLPLRTSDALTRRGILQRAGWIVVASAIPPAALFGTKYGVAMAAGSVSPVMAKLSAYMSEAGNRALPDDVVEETKHHILDTIAAMVSGSELPPGRAAIKFARAYGGEKIATVVAANFMRGPIEAALTNGLLAHSDETDDSHAPSESHPGSSVVPAALAAAEQFGIDGMHFLRAVTLGYDVGPRVTMTLGAEPYENSSHRSTHSIATTFGAAAAAGCAAGLNAQQMRWLLNYAAEQSSISVQQERRHVCAGSPAASTA